MHCTESRTVLKISQQENDVGFPLQYCSQLLSLKFEGLIHKTFRNENLILEINVSYFKVLHWQYFICLNNLHPETKCALWKLNNIW